MIIETLDYPTMSNAAIAWALSRDPEATYQFADITKIDAPVMEMPSAMLHFSNFCIMDREIICSLRNHVVWARTSRVDDPLRYSVPAYFDDGDAIRKRMQKLAADGVKQDNYRLLLPVTAYTSWTQRISMRDLARLVHYFAYLAERVKGPLQEHWMNVHALLEHKLAELMTERAAHDLLASVHLVKFLHERKMNCAFMVHDIYHFYAVETVIPVALRAQLIRHREVQFMDDFLYTLLSERNLNMFTLGSTVSIQFSVRKDVWKSIISKRLCWIAQRDLWEPLLRSFEAVALPCRDGICPYATDAKARLVAGNDPNPPCPRYCNLYHVDKTPYYDAMSTEARKRGAFWVEELDYAE